MVVACAAGLVALSLLTAPGPHRDPAAHARPVADKPATDPSAATASNDEPVDFNRDIRPILSDRCFACHGPDAAVAKHAGGFRLDRSDTATAQATSGKRPIVPGHAGASELIRRVTADKPNLQMPPPASNLTLSEHEIELLTRWIDQGAKYEGHWAYQTPQRPAPPAILAYEDWVRNDIDRFIAARLEQAGLEPSPQADRATLIRRLSLDLTGLPPTPDQIDAFIHDETPDAYEQLVDRLLASPHFGERLAVVWLDAARFADTIGYQLDHYRSAWPYRDYVIKAFNDNKPYDRFVVEQLAGDLLPDATDEQKLATAFCRMHMMNHEGGSIDEEFRVVAVADRIETIATVMMAQTYNCAQCHDHKYDPTTQQDYYNLFKYFHSVEERGIWTNKPEHAIAYGPRLDWYTNAQREEIARAQAQLDRATQARLDAAPDIAKQQSAWEAARRETHGVRWAQAELTDAQTTQVGGAITRKPDGSVLLSNRDSPQFEDLTLTYQTDATGLRLIKLDALTDPWNNDRVGRSDTGDAQPTHLSLRATSLRDPTQTKDIKLRWAWATKSEQGADLDELNLLKPGRPGWGTGSAQDKDPRTLLLVADEPFGFEGGTELRVVIEHKSGLPRRTLGRVRVGFAQAQASVFEAFPTVMRDWYQAGPYTADNFDAAFNTAFGPEDMQQPLGPTDAGGNQKWQPAPALTDKPALKVNGKNSATNFARTILTPVQREVVLTLGTADGVKLYLNGEAVASISPLTKDFAQTLTLKPGENRLVLKVINGKNPADLNLSLKVIGTEMLDTEPLALIDPARRTEQGGRAFADQWRGTHSPTYLKATRDVQAAEKALDRLKARGAPITIMQELPEPKAMHLLERGQYDKPIADRPARLELPSFIDLPLPEGAPNNRLGFARWLTRPDHPLTARVHVNRLWQMLFGEGIVATVEDFGNQAAWPTHPDLLDNLAVGFVESGWDQKALIRQIVTSATYRQQAVVTPASIEIDPDNRLLSYFPRRRLAAEHIRDQALAVSGLLVDTIGGPSVKPYQPDGLWREVSMGPRSNTNVFKRDAGEALYRRSLYTFIKRKSPPPQLATFGTPNRESCVVRRELTNTPLQALVLWNDEQFLEAARVLAQRTLGEAAEDDARLSLIFRRCTGRAAEQRELAVLRNVLAHFKERYAASPDDAGALLKQGEHPLPPAYDPAELASWMMVASAVLSLDETIVRD